MKGRLWNRISRFLDGSKGDSDVRQKSRGSKPTKLLPPHFDATFPLETLPFDIKYALLETIGLVDYDSFISLILASRGYHEVFTEHERALNRVALWHDALKYQEENFFLAAVYDNLLDATRPVSVAESERIENAYNDALDPEGASRLEPWYYAAVRDGGEDMKNRVMKNHLVVRRFAGIFIKRAMFPRLLRRVAEVEETRAQKGKNKKKQQRPEPSRKFGINRSVEELCPNEPPVTASEKHRIIKMIYHVSVFILISYSRLRAHRSLDYTRGTIKFLLLWDYWEAKAVEMFIAWLAMEFNPLFYRLYKQGRWWWAWNEHIPSDEDLHSCYEGLGVREEHYGCSLFALLVHEFPFYAAEWINSSITDWHHWHPPPDRLEAITEFTSNFDTRIEIGTAHWMIYRLLYYATYTDEPASDLKLKRICVEGKERFFRVMDYLAVCRFSTDDEFLWGHPERQRMDPWVVVWDDWRLERWGYVLPLIEKSTS
ncbi:hypothetical protein TWF281_011535 [Arthrobotrys megalospora]